MKKISVVTPCYNEEENVGLLYKKVGVLYQSSALLNSFSLYDNIALPIKMHYPELPVETR